MKKKLLVLGTYGDDVPYHPFDIVQDKLAGILRRKAEIACTDWTPGLLRLGGCDGVVSYLDLWNRTLQPAEAQSLARFVEEGGALIALHNGISIQSDDALMQLLGGRFLSHPEQEELEFFPAEKPHPITEGVEPFTLTEEPYRFAFTDGARTPLLSYRCRGQEYPAGWCREAGRGRVVYFAPGHTAEKFDVSAYQTLILRGALWALREL